jgi:hypothetical protein
MRHLPATACALLGLAGCLSGQPSVIGGGGTAGAGGGTAGAGGGGGMAGAGGSGTGGATTSRWPGRNMVVTVDAAGTFDSNLSGLQYQPAAGGSPAVLWAVQNDPSTIYELVASGTTWAPATSKTLRYPNGKGAPDAEGITKAEMSSPALYVAAERDNDNDGTSRLSVLRYDSSATGTQLTATHEWNLTADIPAAGANLGLEAITWVPDTYLMANGFVDESTGAAYAPARYAGHGTGVFLVGVEATGVIYAYALDHTTGGFHKLATISSGQPATMDLSFDREAGTLWADCDDTCNNRASVLQIDTAAGSPTRGRFVVRRFFDRPSTMPNINNEGIAIAPESECMAGFKPFFWTDDSSTDGHALRRDSIPCGMFF